MIKNRRNALKQYVTDSDIDLFTHYVYNDLDLTQLYPEDTKPYNKKLVDKMLLEGEKYASLDNIFPGLIITSYGRFLNGHKGTQYTVGFYKSITFYKRKQRIDVKDQFKLNGWDYDFDEIKNIYLKYNWPYYSSKLQYDKQVK